MKNKISQKEIDDLVIAQADQDHSWEAWHSVNPCKPISLRLSSKTVGALKTLAKLKHEKGYQTLLKKWIDERLFYEQKIISSFRRS